MTTVSWKPQCLPSFDIIRHKSFSDISNMEGNIEWKINGKEKENYRKIFKTLDINNEEKVEGRIIREYYINTSNISICELMQIWNVSDLDNDGCLNFEEFSIMNKIVDIRKEKEINIPLTIPHELLRSAKNDKIGNVTPVDGNVVPLTHDVTFRKGEDSKGKRDSVSISFGDLLKSENEKRQDEGEKGDSEENYRKFVNDEAEEDNDDDDDDEAGDASDSNEKLNMEFDFFDFKEVREDDKISSGRKKKKKKKKKIEEDTLLGSKGKKKESSSYRKRSAEKGELPQEGRELHDELRDEEEQQQGEKWRRGRKKSEKKTTRSYDRQEGEKERKKSTSPKSNKEVKKEGGEEGKDAERKKNTKKKKKYKEKNQLRDKEYDNSMRNGENEMEVMSRGRRKSSRSMGRGYNSEKDKMRTWDGEGEKGEEDEEDEEDGDGGEDAEGEEDGDGGGDKLTQAEKYFTKLIDFNYTDLKKCNIESKDIYKIEEINRKLEEDIKKKKKYIEKKKKKVSCLGYIYEKELKNYEYLKEERRNLEFLNLCLYKDIKYKKENIRNIKKEIKELIEDINKINIDNININKKYISKEKEIKKNDFKRKHLNVLIDKEKNDLKKDERNLIILKNMIIYLKKQKNRSIKLNEVLKNRYDITNSDHQMLIKNILHQQNYLNKITSKRLNIQKMKNQNILFFNSLLNKSVFLDPKNSQSPHYLLKYSQDNNCSNTASNNSGNNNIFPSDAFFDPLDDITSSVLCHVQSSSSHRKYLTDKKGIPNEQVFSPCQLLTSDEIRNTKKNLELFESIKNGDSVDIFSSIDDDESGKDDDEEVNRKN
ncbi:formin 2, putative [Plasmodium ovale wallikeri]|uniref:Formin 2, putative n=1 Tax=Plasmodium ovale wallikeri TaxID=864142 RepID=A0A1A8YMM7_PLAOA|nr:formin 2, putative [Plasmodium ovale wallikeri]